MKFVKTKIQQYGFTVNHIALLAVAVLIFGALVIPKTGLSITSVFGTDEQQPMLTYDQIRGEVYAQMGVGSEDAYIQELENQFALLDRGSTDGAVLGEIIGVGELPDPNSLHLPEVDAKYPARVINDNSPTSISDYQDAVAAIETRNGGARLFAQLSTADTNLLNQSVAGFSTILSEISQLNVPSSQLEMHKVHLSYYYSIMKMAEIYAGSGDESQLQFFLTVMMSTGNKLNSF